MASKFPGSIYHFEGTTVQADAEGQLEREIFVIKENGEVVLRYLDKDDVYHYYYEGTSTDIDMSGVISGVIENIDIIETEINHYNIQNVGTYSHDQIDSWIDEGIISGVIDVSGIYDDTEIWAAVDLNTAKVTNVNHPLVETAVPVGAVFTDTIYDDADVLKDDDTVSPVTGSNKIITQADVGGGGGGDMYKATYDTTDNGVVDNSELVNGLTVETAVPVNALFTDTIGGVTAGDTASRPSSPDTGTPYFDTDLGYQINYNGTVWVNATGATV